jgi:hypothetical protein
MADNRFPSVGVDARFPSPGVDVRFAEPPIDAEHLADGTDTRFQGDTYGGAAAPVAPVVVTPPSILSQPMIGQVVAMDEGEITGATSVAYQWYEGDPGSGGTTVSGAASITMTPAAAEYGSVLWRRATYSNAAGDTVVDTEAPDVVGVQFINDWSALTITDTIAQIDAAGYSRWSDGGSQQVGGTVVADAVNPEGKAVQVTTATNAVQAIYKDDEDSFFGTNGWTTFYEDLYLLKHDGVGGRFFMRGKMVSAVTSVSLANTAAGCSIRLHVANHQLPGEDPQNTTGAILTMTENSYYFIRHRMEGAVSKIKIWLYDDPEPEAWSSTRTHGSTLTGRGPSIGSRATTFAKTFAWWSCGGNAPAPYWPGFVPPVEEFADSLDYAAAGSSSTVTEFGGDTVLTLEDA